MLELNRIITITLSVGIEAIDNDTLTEPFDSYFTSDMSPMYSSVPEVRRIVGRYVSNISDDVINQLILEYSILANNLSICAYDDTWIIFAGRWVAYNVALIILYNSESFTVASSKVFKQLGDFSVSKGGGASKDAGVGKLVSWLECEIFKYDYSVRNCTQPLSNCLGLTDPSAMPYEPKVPGLVERGYADPNKPIVGRRWKYTQRGAPSGQNNLILWGRKYKTNLGTF